MSWGEYLQLAPIWALNLGALALMLQVTWRRSEVIARGITYSALLSALLLTLFPPAGGAPGRLFVVDGLGLFYLALIVVGALSVAISCEGYWRQRESQTEEFFILLLLATAGAGVMALAGHLLPFYLGLEILSVALYGLVAYERQSLLATEAAVKYLLLAAVTAAFFLFGAALTYAEVGSLEISALAATLVAGQQNLVLLAGFGLLLVGVGFKLSLVPFHSWAPDVYEGASLPIAAFFSTVSKAAMVAFLLRLLTGSAAGAPLGSVQSAVALLAILSMVGGNLLALRQTNVKRLLAYSSSAHLGYALVPLVVGGLLAKVVVSAYLATYLLTSLAAFGALTTLVAREPARERDGSFDLRGLRATQPLLCLVLGIALLSLAGMPLTAGFLGKFLVVNAGVRGEALYSIAALVLGSVLGGYYYLRLLVEACKPLPPELELAEAPGRRPLLSYAALLVLAALLIALGVFPERALVALEALLVPAG